MKLKLLLSLFIGSILLSGCVSEGYVATSTVVYDPYPYYGPAYGYAPIVVFEGGHYNYHHNHTVMRPPPPRYNPPHRR